MARAVLFGVIKKVEGNKGGIGIGASGLKLDSGSIKDLFRLAATESQVKITVEPFQEEMLAAPPEPSDGDGDGDGDGGMFDN